MTKLIIGKAEALLSLVGDKKWALNGDTIEWHDEGFPPSNKQIDDEIIRLQKEVDDKEYQRKRVTEYPSIGDQLDALFKAGVFPADMTAKIQAVKDKYPKV